MSRNHLFTLLIFLMAITSGYSQYRTPNKSVSNSNNKWTENLFFGGGGGFNGGTGFFAISVSPLVGYKITDRFSAGIQITYQYAKYNYLDGLSVSNYGGGPFLQYNITESFFTYTQYEYMNFGLAGTEDRFAFYSWFAGIGYTAPISDNVGFNIIALYNLLYKDGTNSPYNSPIVFRVGIVAGF